MAKAKRPNFNTPAGVARYPWLTKPDSGKGRDFVMKPAYKVDLILEADKAQDLIALIDAEVDKAHEAAVSKVAEKNKAAAKKIEKHYPYQEDVDNEGEPTGKTLFKFKCNAEYTDPDTKEVQKIKPPALFDKYGQKFEGDAWSGSIIEVNFQMIDFYNASTKSAGVSLRLRAVKVVDAVAGGADAESYGFEVEELPEGGDTVSDSDSEGEDF